MGQFTDWRHGRVLVAYNELKIRGRQMRHYRIRIKGRLLQAMYRPKIKTFLPSKAFSALDELDKRIEEKITPLLDELFN